VQYRRQQGLPPAAVEIGVMEDIGYVSRNAHVLEHFRTTSTYVIYEQDLLDAFHLMMNKSRPVRGAQEQGPTAKATQFISEGQLGIDLRSTQPLAASNNRTVWKHDPRMGVYWNMESHSATSSTGSNEELTQFLIDAQTNPTILDKETTGRFLAQEIGNTLFSFLMRDLDMLDLEASFEALGVDSLVTIELHNWMRQKVGADIPVLEIMGVANLVGLGGLAAGRLKNMYTQSGKAETDMFNEDAKVVKSVDSEMQRGMLPI
jgi:acyl carrier protein